MQRERRLIGWFALFLGASGLLFGALTLAGELAPAQGLACKAICGWRLLITEIAGERAGTLAAGLLGLAAGAAFWLVGYRVLKR